MMMFAEDSVDGVRDSRAMAPIAAGLGVRPGARGNVLILITFHQHIDQPLRDRQGQLHQSIDCAPVNVFAADTKSFPSTPIQLWLGHETVWA